MSTPYQFPVWNAGQSITAGQLTQMEPQFIVTPTTTTRASTTTMANDPFLQFQVTAGGVYVVEFEVGYTGLSAAGIATMWNVPSGTNGFRSGIGPGSTSSNANADNIAAHLGAFTYNIVVAYGCPRNSTSLNEFLRETSAFTAGSTGTVALAWAQATSNATGTTVQAGSWARCTQLQ
jgi:hypothetical protein